MPDAQPQGQGTPAPSTGQSPPGSSPATTPVPNRGQEAAALATLNVIVNALLKLAPQFGASSDVGQAVLKSVQTLSKHVPPGSTSAGVENNAMMKMQREQAQQQPMAAMMRAQGGQQTAAPPPEGA